jgi:hypothetical protein
MSKNVFLFLLLTMTVKTVSSQRRVDLAYEKGLFLVDLHTSLGLYKSRDFVTQRIPVFIGADYGADRVFSIGAFGGWSQRTLKDVGFPAYDVNYYYYGGRVSAHLTDFINKNTVINLENTRTDFYVTAWLGRNLARQVTFSGNPFLDSGGATIYGAYLGARIYTMYRLGFMIEAGAGPFGVFNAGICVRF